jgi:hypothetical protein
MVAIFLFLPPCHYTKNTYLTFPNHTTPLEKRDRVHVNICNKHDGMKKILYFDIIHPSFIHLGSSALIAVSKKVELWDIQPHPLHKSLRFII